jgi:hypothetical protein
MPIAAALLTVGIVAGGVLAIAYRGGPDNAHAGPTEAGSAKPATPPVVLVDAAPPAVDAAAIAPPPVTPDAAPVPATHQPVGTPPRTDHTHTDQGTPIDDGRGM